MGARGRQSGRGAAVWSMAYPIFHWGFTGWALYCLPAVAVAYAYHVRGVELADPERRLRAGDRALGAPLSRATSST